jgi:putative membrane protein
MIRISGASLLVLAALAASTPAFAAGMAAAPAAAASMAAPVSDPQQFTTQAAIGNMFEIQSSELAMKQSSNDQVKQFAQRMITDHGKAATDMQPAASTDGTMVPSTLDATHEAQLQQLSGLSGGDFDTAYITAQVGAHDDAVALFEGYSSGGKAGSLKDFAAKTLPTLQQHQQMIHGMAGK